MIQKVQILALTLLLIKKKLLYLQHEQQYIINN